MKVTLKKLNNLKACPDGIEWFKSYTGDKELIPLVKKLIKVNIDWANWLITHYMTEEQCKKYITNPEIYDNARAYADVSAYAYADVYKRKLTEIVKLGIKILGGAK